MRLNMAYLCHGKTATGGCEVGEAGAESGGTRDQRGGITGGSSRAGAGDHWSDVVRDGDIARGGTRYRGAFASEVSAIAPREGVEGRFAAPQLGRAAQCVVDGRGRTRVSGALAGASAGGRRAGGVAATGG